MKQLNQELEQTQEKHDVVMRQLNDKNVKLQEELETMRNYKEPRGSAIVGVEDY